jgi:transglycosylase-like protein with SLT domain
LNVTAFIAIVSRARAYILRLSIVRIHDLVVSDWTARAVLRYWRLQNRARQLLLVIRRPSLRLSVTTAGHAFALSLGFLVVTSAIGPRVTAMQAAGAGHSVGNQIFALSTAGIDAADVHDVSKPERLELRLFVAPTSQPAAPAPPVAPPKPTAVVGTFTPPPGSGGDGLAAIYAVFGNSSGLSWALRVANCESHYNPLAVNRYSGASGLFQFMPSTWNANFPGQNIWDPYAQARGALAFYNAGRQSAWTCK